MKLTGVAAIVTGGGSGLGRATAEALAAKGAKVTVFDLNPAAAEEAAKATGGLAVMAIGGFNGSDPAPTLSQFESMVAKQIEDPF